MPSNKIDNRNKLLDPANSRVKINLGINPVKGGKPPKESKENSDKNLISL